MIGSSRFSVPLALAVAVAIPLFANGCSATSNPLCCTEFTPGATINASIGGSAQSQVAVQAIADISGIAAAAVDDLTGACRGIATDLHADATMATAAEANTDANAKMKAWCSLAAAQITMIKGSATLTINVTPAQCSASLSAQANCQAKCDVSGMCDIKANPPTCMGGTLDIDCKGSCDVQPGQVSIDCQGSCMAMCSGSCTAMGGVSVDCNGKCDGTCTAKAGVGNGMGAQADGTCQGTCSATCTASATAPAVMCTGSCSGKCTGSCKATGTAPSVKCSGKCSADYTPLSCSGGTLSGGCMVDAKCSGNCNASVQATASCTPPSVDITFSGSTNLDDLVATLKANLPAILLVKTKFELIGNGVANVSGNVSAVTDIKAACIPAVIAAGAQAASDVGDTASATVSITGAVGM